MKLRFCQMLDVKCCWDCMAWDCLYFPIWNNNSLKEWPTRVQGVVTWVYHKRCFTCKVAPLITVLKDPKQMRHFVCICTQFSCVQRCTRAFLPWRDLRYKYSPWCLDLSLWLLIFLWTRNAFCLKVYSRHANFTCVRVGTGKEKFYWTISWAPINPHWRWKVWHPCFNEWTRSNKSCEILFALWKFDVVTTSVPGQHVLLMIFAPHFLCMLMLDFSSGSQDWCILEGMVLHALWSILAVSVLAVFAFLRLLVSNSARNCMLL